MIFSNLHNHSPLNKYTVLLIIEQKYILIALFIAHYLLRSQHYAKTPYIHIIDHTAKLELLMV